MAKKPDDWKRTWRRFPSFIVVLDSPRRQEENDGRRASQIEPLMIIEQRGVKHSDNPARCPRLSSIRFTLPKGAQNAVLARTNSKRSVR